MTRTLPDHLIRREGRLLFVLLDAAENNRMMSARPQEARWRDAKERVLLSGDFERDAAIFYQILGELAAGGLLAGTWIEQRWLTVKARIEGAD